MANEWMDKYTTYAPGSMGLTAYWGMRQGSKGGARYSNQQIVAGARQRGLHIGRGARAIMEAGPQPNWMNQYTGSEGGIGLSTYNRLKGVAGKTVLDIQRDQHASGMQMGRLAREQFHTDLQDYHQQQANERVLQQQAAQKEREWQLQLQRQMEPINTQINKPANPVEINETANLVEINDRINEPANPVETRIPGYRTSSTVGGGATASMKIREPKRGSGTKKWKRTDPSWSMPTLNTGGTSGKAGNSSPVNV